MLTIWVTWSLEIGSSEAGDVSGFARFSLEFQDELQEPVADVFHHADDVTTREDPPGGHALNRLEHSWPGDHQGLSRPWGPEICPPLGPQHFLVGGDGFVEGELEQPPVAEALIDRLRRDWHVAGLAAEGSGEGAEDGYGPLRPVGGSSASSG
jgi:hypothetical protein